MNPRDDVERPTGADDRLSGQKHGLDTVSVGVLITAVGICCVTTLLLTSAGAALAAGIVAIASGWGVLVVPLVVGAVGLVWAGRRRHRADRARRPTE